MANAEVLSKTCFACRRTSSCMLAVKARPQKECRCRFARGAYANYEARWENVAVFGTAEFVEGIEGLRRSGIEKLIFFVNYGHIENHKVLDALELFATKVISLFKD